MVTVLGFWVVGMLLFAVGLALMSEESIGCLLLILVFFVALGGFSAKVYVEENYIISTFEEVSLYDLVSFDDTVLGSTSVKHGIFALKIVQEDKITHVGYVERDDGLKSVKYFPEDGVDAEVWISDTLEGPAGARVVAYTEFMTCNETFEDHWLSGFWAQCEPDERIVEYRIYIPRGSIINAGEFELDLE